MQRACDFDRRIIPYQDVFLLHPVMPPASGSTGPIVEHRAKALNGHLRLDWEIEDLLSPRLLRAFQAANPGAVVKETTAGTFRHRDFTRQGKTGLLRFVRDQAALEDVMDVVRLVCALRDYLQLPFNHIPV